MTILGFVIVAIDWIFRLLELLVIAQVILSYFMSPFHPVRIFIDRMVNPLLNPIRRVVPSFGGLDFSPLVLLILLQLLQTVVVRLLLNLLA